MFFIGIPTETVDETTAALLREISPGGICLFSRNCKQADMVRQLLDSIRSMLPMPPFLSLDQEGGLVDRLRRVAEPMPSVAETSAKGSEVNIRRLAEITAEMIRILGFNMNFAPVLDVIDEKRAAFNNGLFSRAFGRSVEDVSRLAGAYADSLWTGGVMPCFKHFPGIGAIEVDSHDELPSVRLSRHDLFSIDLVPYKQLLQKDSAHAVMTGHAVFPEFDLQERGSDGKLLPTSLSGNIVTKLLREELDFKGLALTDDLEMGAIVKHYGIGEASKLAVAAGNDFVLICNEVENVYKGFEAVLNAVESGEIPESRLDESIERIQTARRSLKAPLEFDATRISELSAEIKELKAALIH